MQKVTDQMTGILSVSIKLSCFLYLPSEIWVIRIWTACVGMDKYIGLWICKVFEHIIKLNGQVNRIFPQIYIYEPNMCPICQRSMILTRLPTLVFSTDTFHGKPDKSHENKLDEKCKSSNKSLTLFSLTLWRSSTLANKTRIMRCEDNWK